VRVAVLSTCLRLFDGDNQVCRCVATKDYPDPGEGRSVECGVFVEDVVACLGIDEITGDCVPAIIDKASTGLAGEHGHFLAAAVAARVHHDFGAIREALRTRQQTG
jgi:hypothetical protein